MGNGRNKRFVSIGKKIVWAITFFMFLFIILFSLYIYYSMQKNAMERYEQNVMIDTEIAGNNIDYYVESMIRATKSVYINHPLMEFLKNHHSKKEFQFGVLYIYSSIPDLSGYAGRKPVPAI